LEKKFVQVANRSAGFLAALDQLGASTPNKALSRHGVPEDKEEGEMSTFHAVNAVRSRIIASSSFLGGDRGIVDAILFENTMNGNIEGVPTFECLWEKKRVVPFLKMDKGLIQKEENEVQLMKPTSMPELEAVCDQDA
jgi:fructose-bisphosphate aldolase class I